MYPNFDFKTYMLSQSLPKDPASVALIALDLELMRNYSAAYQVRKVAKMLRMQSGDFKPYGFGGDDSGISGDSYNFGSAAPTMESNQSYNFGGDLGALGELSDIASHLLGHDELSGNDEQIFGYDDSIHGDTYE